jgi:hypothetical protein
MDGDVEAANVDLLLLIADNVVVEGWITDWLVIVEFTEGGWDCMLIVIALEVGIMPIVFGVAVEDELGTPELATCPII